MNFIGPPSTSCRQGEVMMIAVIFKVWPADGRKAHY